MFNTSKHLFLQFCTFAAIIIVVLCSSETEVKETSTGQVQGKRIDVLGVTLDTFEGIPFAEPPVGKLRFKRPEPKKKWDGVLQVQNYSGVCSQQFNNVQSGSEDCLHLNVYSPILSQSSSERLPVVISIHGGGFVMGYGIMGLENHDFITKSKSVFVTFNYRLAAFGFLNCDDPDAPGNMGLFDQLMAMQWVNENIGKFGGDKNRVTLFGLSAGAASVHYHSANPLSAGLFNRKIMLSGSANAPWAFTQPKEAKRRCEDLLEILECPSDIKESLECLNKKTDKDILLATSQIKLPPLMFSFVPSIDGNFLKVSPQSSYFNDFVRPAPTIVVANKDEGSMFITMFLGQFITDMSQGVSSSLFTPVMEYLVGSSGLQTLPKLMERYIGQRNVTDSIDATTVISDYLTDKMFVCPILEAMEPKSMKHNSYYYHFVYLLKDAYHFKWSGVTHVDYARFLVGFTVALPGVTMNKEELQLASEIIEKITSFIHDGQLSDILYKDGYSEVSLETVQKNLPHPRQDFCQFLRTFDKQHTDSPSDHRSKEEL